jgi:hypothetical protein
MDDEDLASVHQQALALLPSLQEEALDRAREIVSLAALELKERQEVLDFADVLAAYTPGADPFSMQVAQFNDEFIRLANQKLAEQQHSLDSLRRHE